MKRYTLIIILIMLLQRSAFSQCVSSEEAGKGNMLSKTSVSYDQYVSAFFSQVKLLYGLDGEYYYYDDAAAPNAQASPDDGNVYLGITILNQCFRNHTDYTGMYFIIAHEMSHLLQYKNPDKWLKNFDGKVRYSELQADYMAGYVLGRLKYINIYNYKQLLTQVWSLGDPTMGWNQVSAHGTSTERVEVAYMGLLGSAGTVETALDASMAIVPPVKSKINKRVAEINLNNGNKLYVLYGGKVTNSNYEQVGQFTAIPDSYNFRINFSKSGMKDLIVSGTNVYNLQNQLVGTYKVTN